MVQPTTCMQPAAAAVSTRNDAVYGVAVVMRQSFSRDKKRTHTHSQTDREEDCPVQCNLQEERLSAKTRDEISRFVNAKLMVRSFIIFRDQFCYNLQYNYGLYGTIIIPPPPPPLLCPLLYLLQLRSFISVQKT